MAISVDTVYQRVLAMANKEQRGYITPQEFNLLANQAQLQIFESYFYNKNQRERLEANKDRSFPSESDISDLITRKLAPFTTVQTVTSGHTFPTSVTISSVARPVWQIGAIYYSDYECRRVPRNDIKRLIASSRHFAGTVTEPIYIDNNTTSDRDITVYSDGAVVTSSVTCETIAQPREDVAWGYVVVNEKALYNSNTSVNFELHDSEEDTLVIKILDLAGIVINKPGLTQTTTAKDNAENTNQKT